MLTKTRIATADRSWRGIVFSAAGRRVLLTWLALSFAAIVANLVPGLGSISAAAIHYVVPVGFIAMVWIVASSYALTAAVSFMRREIGAGVWMSAWALLLACLGAAAVRFLLYG
jgi:hypothetical protein